MCKDFIINLKDASLFGNSASEDEDIEIFSSYAVRRNQVNSFISNDKIVIIKTLKGCGKSAIMRISIDELEKKNIFCINLTSHEIACDFKSEDPDEWVTKWKEAIYTRVAEDIGSINNIEVDGIEHEIRKLAIDAGKKKKNFIDMLNNLLLNIDIKTSIVNVGARVNGEDKNFKYNAENILKRGLKESIYIFIDDIDHNFRNNVTTKSKIVGLLTACRYISNDTPNIHFRLTLRPNSWNIIKKEYSSMSSHVSQYIIEMRWTHGEIKKLLEQRIYGYLKRNYPNKKINHEQVFSLVFDEVIWDTNRNFASQPIATYSKHRPRWAKDIFKCAADFAMAGGRKRIILSDINAASEKFGETILTEISAEFCCEYEDIEKYIRAFYGEKNSFKEDELFKVIKNKILNHISQKLEAREIAYALFYCGFLYARENFNDGKYKNYYFDDKPHLFTENNNESGKYLWEIDLIFRNVLKINTSPLKNKKGSKYLF